MRTRVFRSLFHLLLLLLPGSARFSITMLASFLYIESADASDSLLPIVLFDMLPLLTFVTSVVPRCDICALPVPSLGLSCHTRHHESFLTGLRVFVEVSVVIRAVVRLKLSHGDVDADVGARTLFQDKPQQD